MLKRNNFQVYFRRQIKIKNFIHFQATDFIPLEALTKVAETDLKCPALWSVNKNQVGVHLTLFWPTAISDENTAKLEKLTDEERKFITQNPALLEFILNQKKIKAEQQQSVSSITVLIRY